MTFIFVVGLFLCIAALGFGLVGTKFKAPVYIARIGGTLGVLLGCALMFWSTAIYVEDNQGGVVTKKFGSDLAAGRIIATEGQKGPQAYVLPPGWHFGYWPWLYEKVATDNIDIPQGMIGVLTAKDGEPLAKGDVFADAWERPEEMLDGQKFLTGGKGFKGPQLTVLPPGQYRFNPRLFTIEQKPALEVKVGSVAVIKANAGPKFEGETELVNGVPIVENEFRGIWKDALTPNAYYLHPDAYVVTAVETTNRMYSYTKENAIEVRTKDGFVFPVDVRVSVKITAEDAPLVVAMLADPDAKSADAAFTILEERVILPLVRTIFRNTAESFGALEYVATRSTIEQQATAKFKEGLLPFKIQTDGLFIADIGIDESEEGKKLLQTQTDLETAVQEQLTFAVQTKAEEVRALQVKAKGDADQEELKAVARAKMDIAESEAAAAVTLAEGEAKAYQLKIAALESPGVQQFITLQLAEKFAETWTGNVPQILTMGGSSNGNLDALIGTMLKKEVGSFPSSVKKPVIDVTPKPAVTSDKVVDAGVSGPK